MKNVLKSLNQKPIAYYPIYRQITGSTTAGILLSQLMYWFSVKDKFYKTDEEIKKETLLTKKELENAKNKIKKLEFIEISREGIPAKTYYKIDWNLYFERLNNAIQGGETIFHQRGKLQTPKGGNYTPPKGETITIIQENTAENTYIDKSSDVFFDNKKQFNYFKNDEVNKLMNEYLKFRKSKKLSNSDIVIKRLINKLKEFYNKGHQPQDIILNALTNGWKDFYEPKLNNKSDEIFIKSAKQNIDEFVKGEM